MLIFFCKMHDKLLVKEETCVGLAGRARKNCTCLPGAVNFNCSWAGENGNLVVRPSGHENLVSVILVIISKQKPFQNLRLQNEQYNESKTCFVSDTIIVSL